MSSVSFLLALFLTACGGGSNPTSSGGGEAPGNNITPQATGALSGTVVNAKTGAGIKGPTAVIGSLTQTTDVDGKYAFAQVPVAERVVVKIDAKDFSEGLSIASVSTLTTAQLSTKLIPVGAISTIQNYISTARHQWAAGDFVAIARRRDQ